MFKEKVGQLLEKYKNDTKALDMIERELYKIFDYVHILESGKSPQNSEYEDCLAAMKRVNALFEKANADKIFPRLEEMSKFEVTKEYIIGLSDDYVAKRKK